MTKSRRDTVYSVCLISLAVLLAFFPTFWNKFVGFDDNQILLSNPDVIGFDVKRMFTSIKLIDYLPFTILSFAVEHALVGFRPFLFHFDNFILHVLNCILVFFVARRLTEGRTKTALFVSLLFGIHPLRVESVAWVTERKDVLMSFFFFSALVIYLNLERIGKVIGTWGAHALCLVAVTASIMSKSQAVVFPAVILLYHFHFDKKKSIRPLRLAPYFVLAILFAVLNLVAHNQEAGGVSFNAIDGLHNAFNSYIFYVSKIIVPTRLSVMYQAGFTEIEAWRFVVAAVALAELIAVAFKYERGRGVISFGLAYFAIVLLPVSRVIPFGSQAYGDRFTYLASFGFCLSLVRTLDLYAEKNMRRKVAYAACLSCILVLFAFLTNARTRVFHDAESLWTDAREKYPDGPFILNNLGSIYAGQGRLDLAEQCFTKALEREPTAWSVMLNLGGIYMARGNFLMAMMHFRKSAEINPKSPFTHIRLADAETKLGNVADAEREYKAAVALEPTLAGPRIGLGNLYVQSGRLDDAISQFENVVKLAPTDISSRSSLASLFAAKGELDKAEFELRSVLAIDGGYVAALYQLAMIELSKSDISEAKKNVEKGLSLAPNSAQFHDAKGVILFNEGNLKEAADEFRAASSFAPNWRAPLNHLAELFDRAGDRAGAADARLKASKLPQDNGFTEF